MKYAILSMLWISYCALHSALITPGVTSFLRRRLGEAFKFYRLSYNLLALTLLVPIFLYADSIRQPPFFTWESALLPVRYLLQATGLILFIAGARQYDMLTFLGLRQISEDVSHNLINSTGKLDASGILGVVRHPFYTAVFPLIWATDLDVTSLISNSILSIYLVTGTILEEKKLVREFGDEYKAYQERVSMLFPMKWILRKLNPGKYR
ncbi:MAG: NnrU family protein [Bacteroidetes bacterium]|nr:NnrU family protein [Bacteroidota bacterium]